MDPRSAGVTVCDCHEGAVLQFSRRCYNVYGRMSPMILHVLCIFVGNSVYIASKKSITSIELKWDLVIWESWKISSENEK